MWQVFFSIFLAIKFIPVLFVNQLLNCSTNNFRPLLKKPEHTVDRWQSHKLKKIMTVLVPWSGKPIKTTHFCVCINFCLFIGSSSAWVEADLKQKPLSHTSVLFPQRPLVHVQNWPLHWLGKVESFRNTVFSQSSSCCTPGAWFCRIQTRHHQEWSIRWSPHFLRAESWFGSNWIWSPNRHLWTEPSNYCHCSVSRQKGRMTQASDHFLDVQTQIWQLQHRPRLHELVAVTHSHQNHDQTGGCRKPLRAQNSTVWMTDQLVDCPRQESLSKKNLILAIHIFSKSMLGNLIKDAIQNKTCKKNN